MTPEDVRLPEEDNKSYDQEEFKNESFTLSRPPRVARVPEGTHVATVEKMRQTKEPDFNDESILVDKVIVLFNFGPEYGTLQKHMNLSFHPKSILGQFLTAVLGEIPININSDDLIGKQLRITVVHEEKGADTWERIPKEGGFKRMKA